MALIYAGAVGKYGNFSDTSKKDEKRHRSASTKDQLLPHPNLEKTKSHEQKRSSHKSKKEQHHKEEKPIRKRSTLVTEAPPKIVPAPTNSHTGQMDFRKLLAYRKQFEYERRGICIVQDRNSIEEPDRWPQEEDLKLDEAPTRKISMSWNSGINTVSLEDLEAFDNRQKLKKNGTIKKLQKQIKKIVL